MRKWSESTLKLSHIEAHQSPCNQHTSSRKYVGPWNGGMVGCRMRFIIFYAMYIFFFETELSSETYVLVGWLVERKYLVM